MKQMYVATLAAAAMVGAVGGTTLALRSPPDAASGSTRTPAATASSSPGSPASAVPTRTPAIDASEPLWTTPTSIHDGDRVVDVVNVGDIDQVWRTSDGYLATQTATPSDPAVGVYRVAPDGLAELMTFILGRGSVDPTGQQFIGLDLDSRTYQVREITTGDVQFTVEQGTRPESSPTPSPAADFAPDGVVTQWRTSVDGEKERYLVHTQDADTSTSTEISEELTGWASSATQDLLVGNTRNPDPQAYSGFCLLTGTALGDTDRVQNCDLSTYGKRAVIDASGTRVLAVPAMTDGFGPGNFTVVDIRTGEVQGSIDLPEWSTQGAFLDQDTLVVHGAYNGNGKGTVIYRCELHTGCREVARTEADGQLGTTG